MATSVEGQAGSGSHSVSTIIAEGLIIILIVIAIITNVILHRIESWIGIRHRNLYVLLNIIYRELMILGLISFVFILYETIVLPPPFVVLSFEVAHLYIFLLAIFYTVVVSSAILISLRMSYRWKNMEALTRDEYRELEAEHSAFLRLADADTKPFQNILFFYMRNIFSLPRYFYVHEVVTFHDARAQFIHNRRLPSTFRFSTFLRKIKSVVFLDLVESHRSLHIILLVIVLSDILRRHVIKLSSMKQDTLEFTLIIIFASTLSMMTHVLALKIRHVYLHMTTDPAVILEIGRRADGLSTLPSAEFPERVSIGRPRAFISLQPDSGNEADKDEWEPTAQPCRYAQRLSTVQAATVSELMQLADRDAASVRPSSADSKLRPAFRAPGARGHILSSDQAPDLCRTAVVHSLDGYLFRNVNNVKGRASRNMEHIMSNQSTTFNDRGSTEDSDEIREIVEKKALQTVAGSSLFLNGEKFGQKRVKSSASLTPMEKQNLSHVLDAALLESVRPVNSGSSENTDSTTIPLDLRRARSLFQYITRSTTYRTREKPHAAEKYFWLGSHRLFLWCVEFVMFFSTVLLTTACTGLALISISSYTARWTHVSSAIAAMANLLHMLVRIAGIIKKYIIVLHNGGLIPEITAKETIKRVRRSKRERGDLSSDTTSGSAGSNGPATTGWRMRMPKKLRRNSAALQRRARSAGDVEGRDTRLHFGSAAAKIACRSHA